MRLRTVVLQSGADYEHFRDKRFDATPSETSTHREGTAVTSAAAPEHASGPAASPVPTRFLAKNLRRLYQRVAKDATTMIAT